MKGKFKKLFRIILSNKRVLFLGLGVVLLLSLVPLHFAQANVFSDIVNFIKNLPISIPTLIIVIPLIIIALALGLIVTFLNGFMLIFVRATMSIGVTPANQQIVEIGWSVSRDLVNLLFILILVFIGLATILRLQTYQAQKTFPLLLIVLLLVNFSGVIVGFIVDISNIVANFFLSQTGSFGALGGVTGNLAEQTFDMMVAPGAAIFAEAPAIFVQAIVTIIYYLLTVLVLFIIVLLFFGRMIALWVLTILAPFAFAAYILPATRSWWNKWWHELIQWSIIGIPIGFFLYLSGKLLENLSVVGFGTRDVSGSFLSQISTMPTLGDIIASVFGNFLVIAMLFIGIMLSVQMAPAGAKQIINLGKKAGMGAMKLGGKVAGTALGRKYSPKVEAWSKRLAERGERPGEEKGTFAKALGRTARFGERWTGRGLAAGAGRISRQVTAKDEDEINAGKGEATNKDSADNFRIINEELLRPDRLRNWNRIAGVLTGTAANGDSNDIQGALQDGTLSGEAVGRALLVAQRAGPPAYRPIAKTLYGRLLADPEQFGEEFSVEKEADGSIKRDEEGTPVFTSGRVQKIVKEIPEKLTNADIIAKILGNTIDKGKGEGEEKGKEFVEFGGELVLRQLVEIRGGDLTSALVRRPESREGRAEILNIFRKISPEDLHKQGADGLIRYLSSTAAQGAGVVSPLLPDETTELLRLLREKDQATARGRTLGASGARRLHELVEIWTGEISPSATAPSTPPELTEIEKLAVQINKLKKEKAKPFPGLSPTERNELLKGQNRNLKNLQAKLRRLRKVPRPPLSPEEKERIIKEVKETGKREEKERLEEKLPEEGPPPATPPLRRGPRRPPMPPRTPRKPPTRGPQAKAGERKPQKPPPPKPTSTTAPQPKPPSQAEEVMKLVNEYREFIGSRHLPELIARPNVVEGYIKEGLEAGGTPLSALKYFRSVLLNAGIDDFVKKVFAMESRFKKEAGPPPPQQKTQSQEKIPEMTSEDMEEETERERKVKGKGKIKKMKPGMGK